MNWKNLRRLGALLLAAAMTVSLAVLPAAAEETEEKPLTGVVLSVSGEQTLAVGETLNVTATPQPTDTTDEVTWEWELSAGGVVTLSVDETDKNKCTITAQKPGKVTVTATATAGKNTHSSSCTVEVSGIVMEPTSMELLVGEMGSLTTALYGKAQGEVTWSTSNLAVADVGNGRVTAYYPGTATITATSGAYTATCTVKVEEDVAETVTESVKAGEAFSFENLLTKLDKAARGKVGSSLSYVNDLRVSPSQGTLYYGYDSTDNHGYGVGNENYYVKPGNGQSDLSKVVFLSGTDFTGTAQITYTGYTSSGRSFDGKIELSVSSAGMIYYAATSEEPVYFETADFSAISLAKTGKDFVSVKLIPPASQKGTLYYNYNPSHVYHPEVSSGTLFYRTKDPGLDDVVFIPESGYSGAVDITYYCTTASGTFSGTVRVQVTEPELVESGKVAYRSETGEVIHFDSADFNQLCKDRNGSTLSYLYFEQPLSSEGTLYRSSTYSSSTMVQSTTKFYRSSGSYQISDIIFVPNSNYTGTFEIPFHGYDTSGEEFAGTVRITVSRQLKDSKLTYQVSSGAVLDFDVDDFDSACQQITGERLNYVRFTQPSSSTGKLYYNYDNKGGTGTTVNSSTSYYRTGGTRLLEKVSFRAADKFTGTVTISYTGLSTGGTRYSSTVEITVSGVASADVVYAGSALPIQLKAEDFNDACQRKTGRELSNLSFTQLPLSAEGTLFWNYETPMQTGTAVSTSDNYKVSGTPALSNVTFVPRAGYQGTVSIPWSGVTAGGHTVTGTLTINLSNWYSYAPFGDLGGYETAQPSVEFLYDCGVVVGYEDGTYGPGRSLTRGEFTVMIDRAFELPAAETAVSFPDVAEDSYYASSIAAAKALGIVQGYDGQFRPQDTITRQDAMTMVLRAAKATGKAIPDVTTSVLASYKDGGQVSAYARAAVSVMAHLGAVDTTGSQQIRPFAAITRAEMAVLLHYVLTLFP